MGSDLRFEKLRRDHAVEGFDCGSEPLNRFLVRYALQSQQGGGAPTYLALDGLSVVGFYSLVVGEVAYDGSAERLIKGMPRHPVPVVVLARLAIASGFQGGGLGKDLLKDGMLRTLQAADIAGIRALIVHAKDDAARRFYERFDFIPSPSDPHHLFILLKDLRRLVG
jgi:GNAT superfamily N-acetyltransferase